MTDEEQEEMLRELERRLDYFRMPVGEWSAITVYKYKTEWFWRWEVWNHSGHCGQPILTREEGGNGHPSPRQALERALRDYTKVLATACKIDRNFKRCLRGDT